MRRYLIIVLIIILAGAVYLTNFFITKQRSLDENSRLKQENENLRAQIQEYQIASSTFQTINGKYITAKVFSTYPFNIKNTITVDVGEKQGIKKSTAVLLGENILLGQVTDVFENSSVVQTTFDPNWQLPVRIGEQAINGLFQGGNEPKVVLIEKDKQIQVNDVVYSAGQEFPYGLKIGEVAEIRETAAGVFKEAVLKIPFNVSELREVNILSQ